MNILAYAPYIILLAVSPVIGRYSLKFVYPDVKTFVTSRKWALFAAFGLLAYAPAAAVAVYEFVVPLYSPFSQKPLLFESEGNALFMFAMMLGMTAVYSSVIDFVVVRRSKKTVVGLPKRVISYGIKKQVAKAESAKKKQEITKLTGDLQVMMGDKDDVKSLLDKISQAVGKERQVAAARAEKEQVVKTEFVQVLQSPKELERLISRLDEYGGDLEKLEALVQMPDSSLVSEVMGRGEIVAADLKAKEEAALEKDARLERVREAKETLKAALEKKREKDAVASKEEKEMLMKQLETKIKSSGVKPDQKGHVQDLLGELKERIREEHEVAPGLMPGEDIAEITNSLKELREAEKSVEKKHHGGRPERVEETGEAPAHGRHGKGPEDDIFKAVVGDVREQLSERKEGKAERGKKAREEPEGKRWYEKTLEAPMKEGPLGGGLGEEAGGENVELFEEGLDFGKATGELGLGEGLEGFGDVGELEDLGENVESSEFDGMFVDLGSAKGGCPNCGKKGTTIAYCSSCGKPLCSNCAKSVSGSDEFVKYTCPHCGEEFAMKKRMPA